MWENVSAKVSVTRSFPDVDLCLALECGRTDPVHMLDFGAIARVLVDCLACGMHTYHTLTNFEITTYHHYSYTFVIETATSLMEFGHRNSQLITSNSGVSHLARAARNSEDFFTTGSENELAPEIPSSGSGQVDEPSRAPEPRALTEASL